MGERVTYLYTRDSQLGAMPLPGDTSKIWRHFCLTQEGVPLWVETKDAANTLQCTGQAPYS